MAAAAASGSQSRDIVRDFLRFKLRQSGLILRWPAAPRRAVTSGGGRGPAAAGRDPPPAPPRLQEVLRLAGDELEHRFHGDLAAHASTLLQLDGGEAERRRRLAAVREELFRDGVNWGRIVTMLELGGVLCTRVVQRGGAWQVEDIAEWMEEGLDSPLLRGWMEDNGGWEAFVELYRESGPPSSPWTLRTALGLALLGAAVVLLGVLCSHR
ncbi:uncharacterized protein V6R79_013290 [Siganus canaliculatus]